MHFRALILLYHTIFQNGSIFYFFYNKNLSSQTYGFYDLDFVLGELDKVALGNSYDDALLVLFAIVGKKVVLDNPKNFSPIFVTIKTVLQMQLLNDTLLTSQLYAV